ncbi:MAG: hypothetical protein J6U96_00690 [Elusimicrobiaceae bacterium]|nr:hypothetical protein [Elusimicrobiaceae bacterium]
MTALILGLIAALGIGGGLAIANNSGGSGGNSGNTQVVDVAQQRAALDTKLAGLVPDYSLVSALTDQSQYTITLGTQSDLNNEYSQVASGLAMSGLNGTYDDSDGDLHRQGQLEGRSFDFNGSATARLNLRPENSGEITGTSAQFYLEGGNLYVQEVPFTFTASDKNVIGTNTHVALNDRYDVFVNTEEAVAYNNWGPATIEKWTALYLGGAKVGADTEHPGLTVSDFGIWDDYIHTEFTGSPMGEGLRDRQEDKFIFFDESYAYNKALRTADQVTLTGNVMAHEAEGYVNPKEILQVYTGEITLNLDLANNTLTGSVDMDAPDAYDIANMTGEIKGSVVRFNGLAYEENAPLPTEDNRFLGGMGKLLFGKYGLEMVGVLGNQIEIPDTWGDLSGEELRDYRKQGDSGYVFGAKEN